MGCNPVPSFPPSTRPLVVRSRLAGGGGGGFIGRSVAILPTGHRSGRVQNLGKEVSMSQTKEKTKKK